MFRYFICSARQQTAAVLLIGDHVFFQPGCQLPALDDQHKLCVQIGAAQIEVVGPHGAQLTIYDKGFAMVGEAAVIFQNPHAGIPKCVPVHGIIAGGKEIVAVFNGVNHHGHRHPGRDFLHGIVHIVIEHRIGSVNQHTLFSVLHKNGHGVKDHRLLSVDTGGIGHQGDFSRGNGAGSVILQGLRLNGGQREGRGNVIVDTGIHGQSRTAGLAGKGPAAGGILLTVQQFRIFHGQNLIALPQHGRGIPDRGPVCCRLAVVEQGGHIQIPYLLKIIFHLIQGAVPPLVCAVGCIVDQDLPIMASGIRGIGTDEIIKGIPASKYISVVIHNHVLVMHPSLGFPRKQGIHFVVNLDFNVWMAGQGIEKLAGFHAHQAGEPVHQYLYADSLVGLVKHDCHQVPGAIAVPEIKGGQYNPFPGQVHQAHPFIPGALIGFQYHGAVRTVSLLIEALSRYRFFCFLGDRLIVTERRRGPNYQIHKYQEKE